MILVKKERKEMVASREMLDLLEIQDLLDVTDLLDQRVKKVTKDQQEDLALEEWMVGYD